MNPPVSSLLGITLAMTGVFVFLIITPVHASQPREFQWTTPLTGKVSQGEPARVPLPATVITQLRPGFGDLRLFDREGKEVPYVVYEDLSPAKPEKTLSLTVKEFVETESSDQFVVEKFQRSEKMDSLELLTSARDFRKNVRVEVSTDGQAWNPLTDDAIFDYSSRVSLRKTLISLPSTDAPFFRITISKDPTPTRDAGEVQFQYRDLVFSSNGAHSTTFRVDGFRGHNGGQQADSRIEDSRTLKDLSITQESPGTTCVNLGEVNLPLDRITFEVEDPYFFRLIEVQASVTGMADSFRPLVNGVIHRIPGAASGKLQLDVDIDHATFLRLLVRDGDNPPLTIKSVCLAWNQRVLYFHPRPEETYTLAFGNKNMELPIYDTGHLITNDAKALRAYPEWSVGTVTENPGYSPSWGKAEREEFQGWVLNTLVAVILLGLGYWGVTLLKQLPKSG